MKGRGRPGHGRHPPTAVSICWSIHVRAEAAMYLEEGCERDKRTFEAAVFLVAACEVGVNAVRLAHFTGIDRTDTAWFGIQARRLKIFQHGEVQASRWAPDKTEVGWVQFMLDAMALSGRLICRRGKYKLAERDCPWFPSPHIPQEVAGQ